MRIAVVGYRPGFPSNCSTGESMAAKQQVGTDQQKIPPGILPWHEENWTRFCASLAGGRLAHAVLLGGPRGSGKRHFANEAGALLLCAAPVRQEEARLQACGHCKQCQLVAAGSHPDLDVLVPEDSRVIKIEQVRRLNETVMRSPQVARRKVAVVDTADRLNLNAANALLKTLEEPAEDVILLLLHHAGEPLLPTIRSRCQAQRLPLPSAPIALSWMRSLDPEADESNLETALDRARGAPLLALAMLQGGTLAAGDECLQGLRQFLRGEVPLSEATSSFIRLGLEPALNLLGHWALGAMKLALGDPRAAPGEGREMFEFLARRNAPGDFAGILDQITAARRDQVYNLNPELVINDILLSWKALMPRPTRARAQ